MATLSTTLTLSSTDVISDTLSMTVTDSLSVTAPIKALSKKAVPLVEEETRCLFLQVRVLSMLI